MGRILASGRRVRVMRVSMTSPVSRTRPPSSPPTYQTQHISLRAFGADLGLGFRVEMLALVAAAALTSLGFVV